MSPALAVLRGSLAIIVPDAEISPSTSSAYPVGCDPLTTNDPDTATVVPKLYGLISFTNIQIPHIHFI